MQNLWVMPVREGKNQGGQDEGTYSDEGDDIDHVIRKGARDELRRLMKYKAKDRPAVAAQTYALVTPSIAANPTPFERIVVSPFASAVSSLKDLDIDPLVVQDFL
jgi:hypothetical protein